MWAADQLQQMNNLFPPCSAAAGCKHLQQAFRPLGFRHAELALANL